MIPTSPTTPPPHILFYEGATTTVSVPRRRPKERAIIRERLGDGRPFRVQVVKRHRVAPPVGETRPAQAEREGDDDDAKRSANIQGTGENIVVTTYLSGGEFHTRQ